MSKFGSVFVDGVAEDLQDVTTDLALRLRTCVFIRTSLHKENKQFTEWLYSIEVSVSIHHT
jgi:hypothetical protein